MYLLQQVMLPMLEPLPCLSNSYINLHLKDGTVMPSFFIDKDNFLHL